MRDRFKKKEWDRLLRLPLLMVRMIDPAPEATQALTTEIHQVPPPEDPLHRDLFAAYRDRDSGTGLLWEKRSEVRELAHEGGGKALAAELRAARKTLHKRLSDEEYDRFFASLMRTGVEVIQAREAGTEGLAAFLAAFEPDIEAGGAALGAGS